VKILLFLNDDIHAATCLDLLCDTLKNHQIKIILSQKVGKIDDLPAQLIALKNLEFGGVSKIIAAKNELNFLKEKVFSYDQVNSQQALQDFQNFAPDLIISIRFGQIFKSLLINLAKLGVLNLHSGILPNYRGVLASFWAILNGEKKLGTTLHFVPDAGIDTGDILDFSHSEIDWNSSLVLNINQLYKPACAMLLQNLEKIFAGKKITATAQKNFGAGQYFSYPKISEVENFLKIMPLFRDEDAQKIWDELLSAKKIA